MACVVTVIRSGQSPPATQHVDLRKIQELFEKLGADESGVITLKIFQDCQ